MLPCAFIDWIFFSKDRYNLRKNRATNSINRTTLQETQPSDDGVCLQIDRHPSWLGEIAFPQFFALVSQRRGDVKEARYLTK